MKLIDADALIKRFDLGSEDTFVFVNFKDIVEIIKNQPEAYKADIVATELEQLKLDGACNYKGCADCQYLDRCWDGEMSEEYAIDIAIEIVKRGGMEVIGNILDELEDARAKESDNIIYRDFMKKGRE